MPEREAIDGSVETLKMMIKWFSQKRNDLTKANYGLTRSGDEFDPNYNLLPSDFRHRGNLRPRENEFWREARDERKRHMPRAMCLIGALMYLGRETSQQFKHHLHRKGAPTFCYDDLMPELCETLGLDASAIHPYDDCRTGYEVVLEQWNDEEERTKEDVINVCKRTLERLEAN